MCGPHSIGIRKNVQIGNKNIKLELSKIEREVCFAITICGDKLCIQK